MTGIERIKNVFNTKKRIRLMTHVVGGYPDISLGEALIRVMASKGADLIEIQLPFSDPIADGPVIVQANHYALSIGITTDAVLSMIRKIRKEIDVPILIMSYLNPIVAYGIGKFVQHVNEIGVDGLIIPDYPLDDEEIDLTKMCNENSLALVPLIAPTTVPERIQYITQRTHSPFVYAVLRMGVTGNKTNLDDAGIRYLTMIKEVSGKYVAGGFGIRTREQVVALCEHADCAIIGSALLKEITSAVEEKSDPIAVAERFLDRILF